MSASCAPPGSINLPQLSSAQSQPAYDSSRSAWGWSVTKSSGGCQQLTFVLNDGWTRISTFVTTLV
jgi:hypothetical protein